MKEKFYTYLWLREKGTPYYVGKGCGRRAYEEHSIGKCPPKDRIIIQTFKQEKDALEAEKFLISFYGRADLGTGTLRNYTDGGDGATNVSQHARQCRSRALKGRVFSKDTIAKISIALTGITRSEETKKKIKVIKFQAEYKPGRSGRRGIAWDKTVSKWLVRSYTNGQRRFVGLYKNLDEAIEGLRNATQKDC